MSYLSCLCQRKVKAALLIWVIIEMKRFLVNCFLSEIWHLWIHIDSIWYPKHIVCKSSWNMKKLNRWCFIFLCFNTWYLWDYFRKRTNKTSQQYELHLCSWFNTILSHLKQETVLYRVCIGYFNQPLSNVYVSVYMYSSKTGWDVLWPMIFMFRAVYISPQMTKYM